MRVQDTLLRIKHSRRRHAILKQYKQTAKLQREAEPKKQSPNIDRFPRMDGKRSDRATPTR
jgi:hypothetical protein